MKIAYLVDSSFIIPEKFKGHPINEHITFVPLIIIDPSHKEYKDPKYTIREKDLIGLMDKHPGTFFKTSLTPEIYLETSISKLLETYDYVVGLSIHKGLSNQNDLFEKLEMSDKFKGKFFSFSKVNVPCMSYLSLLEFDFKTKNISKLSKQKMMELSDEISQNQSSTIFLFITKLDRLVASGRISKAKAAFARLGKIKITLKVDETGLNKFSTNRSLLKGIDEALEFGIKECKVPKENIHTFMLFFGFDKEMKGVIMKNTKEQVSNVYESESNPLPSIMSVHIGKESLAVVVVGLKNKEFLKES